MNNEKTRIITATQRAMNDESDVDDLASIELADEVLLHKNSRALDRLELNVDLQKRNRKRRELVLQGEIEALKEQTRRLELGLNLAEAKSVSESAKTAQLPIATRREDLLAAERNLLNEHTRRLELEASAALKAAEHALNKPVVAAPAATSANNAEVASLTALTRTMELELTAIRNELKAFKDGAIKTATLPETTLASSKIVTPWITPAPAPEVMTVAAPTNVATELQTPIASPVATQPVTVTALVVTPPETLTTAPNAVDQTSAESQAATASFRADLATPIVEELKAAQDGFTSIVSTKTDGFVPVAQLSVNASDKRWVSRKVHDLKALVDDLQKYDARFDAHLHKALTTAKHHKVTNEVLNQFDTEVQKLRPQLQASLTGVTDSYTSVLEAQHANDLTLAVERLTTAKALAVELHAKQLAFNDSLEELVTVEKKSYIAKVTRQFEQARKQNTDLISTMMFYIKRVSPVLEKARQDEVARALGETTNGDVKAPAKTKVAKKDHKGQKVAAENNIKIKPHEVKQLVYAWDDVKHRFNVAQVALRNATEHMQAKRYLKAQGELTRFKVLTSDFWDAKRWNEMSAALKGVGAKKVMRKVNNKLWIGLVIAALVLAIAGIVIGALFGTNVLTV